MPFLPWWTYLFLIAATLANNEGIVEICWAELSSPRAESARAVTGRRNSHRWEGGRLFEPSAGFFYGNSCNSGTKSRKIVSKVGN